MKNSAPRRTRIKPSTDTRILLPCALLLLMIAFRVDATFLLPNNSSGCCTNSVTSNVQLASGNKYEFAPHPLDGGDNKFIFRPDESTPRVEMYLRKRPDGGGSSSRVIINVGGQFQSGASYAGRGTIDLNCP